MTETIVINETVNDVIVSSSGVQGPAGRTILNGVGAPAANLGVSGDFFYDTQTTRFYGPKLSDLSWVGANSFLLNAGVISYEMSWEVSQVDGPFNGIFSVLIIHNLGFKPNVTVINSAEDVLETGIYYNNDYILTLTMAQPFAGTAYLS
jgi:hypothetical protein